MRTKEEILIKHLPRGIDLDDVYQAADELQNSIPDAMDQYAKQEAVAFKKWCDKNSELCSFYKGEPNEQKNLYDLYSKIVTVK